MLTLNSQPTIELCTECHFSFHPIPDPVFRKIVDSVHSKSPNDYCRAHEIPFLEPFLEEAENKLSSYNSTLHRLRCTLESLERQRDTLWTLKERLRGQIRPSIRQLPPEILLRIFSLCQDPAWCHSQYHVSLVLSQVCTHWRSIIFSEPSLWADISIGFGPRDDKSVARRNLAYTKFCLEKSRTRPFRLYFDIPDGDDPGYHDSEDYWVPYPDGLHRRCLAEVVKHSARWKHAELYFQDSRDSVGFPEQMPYLEVLQIHIYSRGLWSPEPGGQISTPRLRELKTIGRVDESLLYRLDTSALVQLSTEEREVDVILHIFKKSPKLDKVELWNLASFGLSSATMTPVTSHIRSLEIYCRSAAFHMFKFLHLPSLTSLRLLGDWLAADTENSSSFVDLLYRSQPPLVKLRLENLPLSSSEVEQMMKICPSITTLHLTGCTRTNDPDRRLVTDTLVQMLTVSPKPEETLLPDLIDLAFFASDLDLDIDALVMMIRSRQNWGRIKQLQHFDLHCYKHQLGNSDKEQLLGLSNEKMRVTISHWYKPEDDPDFDVDESDDDV
ncbi:hypothetical protein VNI00_013748 [Paramarasmius palmivorus]|uniref:F-box domain-containing protein n=1 Tax=Paramarasmius palmivorus TaxID=297713 RepID=A0AAW0BWN7_9AGAR